MKEKWKDIEGYEGLYQISTLGRVKGLKTNTILKPIEKKGYLRYEIYKNNVKKRYFAHRLVAQAFIPNPENKPQVNHINGIKNDNRIDNLEWCTNSENQIHAYKNGLELPKQKRAVEQYTKDGKYIKTFEYISDVKKELNISTSSIWAVCKNKRKTAGGYVWKYVN